MREAVRFSRRRFLRAVGRPGPFGLLPLLALMACTTASTQAGQPTGAPGDAGRGLGLSLVNSGGAPLHCRLMFGHWVDRDLGQIGPGGMVEIEISQASRDGALYIMRSDGERRMMIETILCGRDGDWMGSVGQVDLAPARSARPAHIAASCALPAPGGRVLCPPVQLQD